MLNVIEKSFVVLMLLYLSSGLTGFLAGDSPFNVWRVEDNPLLLAIQTVMYAVTLGFVVLHWRKFMSALRAGGWVLALALFALVSTLWSSDPDFTFRRSLVVIATTMFGIYFGSRYELPRQVRLLGWTFIILAVLSAACALLLPQYGIDNQLHRGDWQGILGQKNLLGKAMAVGMIVLWSAKGVLPRVVRIGGIISVRGGDADVGIAGCAGRPGRSAAAGSGLSHTARPPDDVGSADHRVPGDGCGPRVPGRRQQLSRAGLPRPRCHPHPKNGDLDRGVDRHLQPHGAGVRVQRFLGGNPRRIGAGRGQAGVCRSPCPQRVPRPVARTRDRRTVSCLSRDISRRCAMEGSSCG